MNLFLNGMFMVTCYPILFLMYFMFRNAKDKNGWCFGTTLDKELKSDPAVEEIDGEYRKNLKKTTIILAVIPPACFFIPYTSISFSIWTIWICVICFYPMIFFARANKQIQELKQERGWNQDSEVEYTDLKIASVPRKVKLTTFLPAIVMSMIPAVLSFVLFPDAGYNAFRFCVITFAICTLLFYVSAVWTDKQKISVISEDSDTNMNFARAKKQLWKNFWLICIWLHTAFTWFILLAMHFREYGMLLILWGSVVYGVVAVIVSFGLVKKIHELNHKYESKKTIINAADNDKYWPYGLMYYNPNDKHFMVENRMGSGTAMNLATGVGRGTYIFATLLMLIIPISCIWMIMLEFTPLSTKVEENTIICSQLGVEYEIPLEDIEEYTVITELPEMTKVNGTGMDNVLSGTYEIYREGMFEAFLNPQNELFVKIVTEDETYYISGQSDEDTQTVIGTLEDYTSN